MFDIGSVKVAFWAKEEKKSEVHSGQADAEPKVTPPCFGSRLNHEAGDERANSGFPCDQYNISKERMARLDRTSSGAEAR
jgi:hypothetical protein